MAIPFHDRRDGTVYYHGTAHTFEPGEVIEPFGSTNWDKSSGKHVYTTSHLPTAEEYAKHAAYKAGMETKKFDPKVFEVEPVEGHPVTNDPNQRKELFNPDAKTWFRSAKMRVVKRIK